MYTFNQVTLLGYVGREPQLYQSGVCRIPVCTSEKFTDKNGHERESKKWWQVVCFGGTAKWAGETLKKGSAILVTGKAQDRKHENPETGEVRYFEELLAKKVILCGAQRQRNTAPGDDLPVEEAYDDVPF